MLAIAISIILFSLSISALVWALALIRYARELKNERDLFFAQQRNQAKCLHGYTECKSGHGLHNQAKDPQQ